MLHGNNSTHSTDECKVLKQQAQNYSRSRTSGSEPDAKRSRNTTWSRSDNKNNQKSSFSARNTKEQLMYQAYKDAAREHLSMDSIPEENQKEDPPADHDHEPQDIGDFQSATMSEDENQSEEYDGDEIMSDYES